MDAKYVKLINEIDSNICEIDEVLKVLREKREEITFKTTIAEKIEKRLSDIEEDMDERETLYQSIDEDYLSNYFNRFEIFIHGIEFLGKTIKSNGKIEIHIECNKGRFTINI